MKKNLSWKGIKYWENHVTEDIIYYQINKPTTWEREREGGGRKRKRDDRT